MYHAGADDKDVPFTQMETDSAAGDFIRVDDGHDNLEGVVPVRRVIFIFIIIIKTYLSTSFIVNGFINSVKMMDHFITSCESAVPAQAGSALDCAFTEQGSVFGFVSGRPGDLRRTRQRHLSLYSSDIRK